MQDRESPTSTEYAETAGASVLAGSAQASSPLGRFIRRHPILSFFLWFFTVGQALAFFPILASTPGREVPAQPFVVASTLIGLLLPAVMITYVVDGKAGLRSLWRRVAALRVAAGWYVLAILGVPLLAIAITVALIGLPANSSWPALGSAVLPHFLLPLVVTFLPNNLWEEVAWTGFVQARLQAAHGALKAAVVAGPLFALQHISLAVDNSLGGAVMVMVLLTALAIPFRFVTGWLYNRTGSLFLVGLLHAAGNAVAGGSGFQAGYLAAIYPDQQTAYMAHLLAFAVLGLGVVTATRGRLGITNQKE